MNQCNAPELDEELKDKELVIEQTLPCGRDVCVIWVEK